MSGGLPLWGLFQSVLVECRLGEVDVHGVTSGHHVVVVGNLEMDHTFISSINTDSQFSCFRVKNTTNKKVDKEVVPVKHVSKCAALH